MISESSITSLNVSAYKVPTDFPESDGTLAWNDTTLVMVEIVAGGVTGIGYTYGHQSIANVITDKLKEQVIGKGSFQIEEITSSMIEKIRNEGNSGIAFMAVSAVDIALWDLKSKLLSVPLAVLLGMVKKKMLIYGSGGFTSYSVDQIREQFEKWAEEGINSMKMKIGRNPDEDVSRVKAAKGTIGSKRNLFVDANGAYTVKQSLRMTDEFKQYGVSWFEEPVSSDNLKGLKFIRERVPPGMNISAGEYGYALPYFARMLREEAVDILQADITRCGGVTGFIKAGHLCEAFQVPFSSHCAPALHLHVALCLPSFYIAEYFHDHVRIENEFFEGVAQPKDGFLTPDLSSSGLGLRLKKADVEKYRIL